MARTLKACSVCGRPHGNRGGRCNEHAIPARTGTYSRNAAKVRAAATRCHLCGGPFTADDPPVADHVVPRGVGGGDGIENLAPAHRSCNARKPSADYRGKTALAKTLVTSSPIVDSERATAPRRLVRSRYKGSAVSWPGQWSLRQLPTSPHPPLLVPLSAIRDHLAYLKRGNQACGSVTRSRRQTLGRFVSGGRT